MYDRLNDGKCDRQGRFWVGTVAADFDQPDGSLYRLDLDGSVHEMGQKIKVSNGSLPTLSLLEGNTMILAVVCASAHHG
jgi:sugar lactone lactonase YvrE